MDGGGKKRPSRPGGEEGTDGMHGSSDAKRNRTDADQAAGAVADDERDAGSDSDDGELAGGVIDHRVEVQARSRKAVRTFDPKDIARRKKAAQFEGFYGSDEEKEADELARSVPTGLEVGADEDSSDDDGADKDVQKREGAFSDAEDSDDEDRKETKTLTEAKGELKSNAIMYADAPGQRGLSAAARREVVAAKRRGWALTGGEQEGKRDPDDGDEGDDGDGDQGEETAEGGGAAGQGGGGVGGGNGEDAMEARARQDRVRAAIDWSDMGGKVEAFNLREERQLGRFNNYGDFEWENRGKGEEQDAWLRQVDQRHLQTARAGAAAEATPAEAAPALDNTTVLQRLVRHVQPGGESVAAALRRLGLLVRPLRRKRQRASEATTTEGPGANAGVVADAKAALSELTEAADALMRSGDADAYSRTHEEAAAALQYQSQAAAEAEAAAASGAAAEAGGAAAGGVGQQDSSAGLPPVDAEAVCWQYKWSAEAEAEAFGPVSSTAMYDWAQKGVWQQVPAAVARRVKNPNTAAASGGMDDMLDELDTDIAQAGDKAAGGGGGGAAAAAAAASAGSCSEAALEPMGDWQPAAKVDWRRFAAME